MYLFAQNFVITGADYLFMAMGVGTIASTAFIMAAIFFMGRGGNQ